MDSFYDELFRKDIFTEGVLLCGERTDDDDGLAGLLLHDPLLDDDGRLRLVVLLPDRNGFAVVCA